MSIPAWKQAILEKKKQQEEAEKKKQLEKEQYLSSLPPWKRAMLKMKTDGKVATSPSMEKRVVNAFASSTSTTSKPSWVQTRVKKDSNEKPSLPNGDISKPPKENNSVDTTQQPAIDTSRKISITQAMKGKFEQPQNKPSPSFLKKDVKKDETRVKSIPEEVGTKNSPKETKKKDDNEKPATTNVVVIDKPEVEKVGRSSTDPGLNKLRGQFEQPADKKPDRSRPSSQATPIDIDDEKFKSLPKWKQELLLRKRQKTDSPKLSQKGAVNKNTPPPSSPLSKEPPSASVKDQSSPVSKNPPVSPTQSSFPPLKSSSSSSSASSMVTTTKEAASTLPEVVNASDKKDPDSPKMVHKEGKELRPPVFNVKNKWADIKEDDPDFKSLPEWKKTLILRRKNDVKKRTAPLEKKEEKKKEEKNEPLPEPLWTPPTRSVPVREIPNEPVKEETNPLMDMRKSLRHVKRPSLTPAEEEPKKPSGMIQPKIAEQNFTTETEETLSPLKPKKDKPKKKLRRVSWSDTDLNKGLTVEFTYPKYSYEDYFEIDHSSVEETDSGGKSTDSNELATPIHPSLSSPSKNSDSTDFSSPTSAGSGSFGDSSSGGTGSFGGSAKTFSFSGMPSLGSFMSAYTSGSGGMSNSYSSPTTSSSTSSSFDQPTEKQNPIVETNKEEEEIDENAAALLW